MGKHDLQLAVLHLPGAIDPAGTASFGHVCAPINKHCHSINKTYKGGITGSITLMTCIHGPTKFIFKDVQPQITLMFIKMRSLWPTISNSLPLDVVVGSSP